MEFNDQHRQREKPVDSNEMKKKFSGWKQKRYEKGLKP
jgi:hypothetical protein